MGISSVVKKGIAESTAGYFLFYPINVFTEKVLAGMTHAESITSRVSLFLATYALIPVAMGVRRYTLRKFNIDVTDKQALKKHDRLFAGAAILMVKGAAYTFSNLAGDGSIEPLEVALGMGIPTAIGLVVGDRITYMMDVGRETSGLEPFQRTPTWLREKSQTFRHSLAAGYVAASFAIGAGIYAMTSVNPKVQEKTLEEKVRFYEPSRKELSSVYDATVHYTSA